MKVLFINSVYKSGSTGRIISQIIDRLEKNGDHGIVVIGNKNNTASNVFSVANNIESHLHSFISRKMCMQGLGSIFQTIKTINIIKNENPDLINIHNIHGHYLNYPLLFSFLKKYDKPVVWSLHDCWAFTGNCSHFTAAGCYKWKTGCYNCPNLSIYPNSDYDGTKRNYRLKKKYFTSIKNMVITCDSKWLKSQVEESFLKKYPVVSVYPGIDINTFHPMKENGIREKYNIPKDKKVVLAVSSVWKKEKGLNTLLTLSKKLPDNVCIVMVGLDKDQLDLLPDNVIGILRTESVTELASIYACADLLINPSEEECFGMVIAEALACGTPVIVSNKTGCPETTTSETGTVIDMSDERLVYSTVELMLKNPLSREACVKRATSEFSLNKMVDDYINVFKKMI